MKKHLILEAYRGSVAHNMYVPNTDPNSIDDIDTMSVFIGPKSMYLGLGSNKRRTYERMEERNGVLWDEVHYEIQKFFGLLLKGNPNVVSMLWLNPKHYVHLDKYGKLLIENRNIFACRQMFHSFAGYAAGQLHRMEKHAKKGYMGEKRSRLIKKFGYDTKNAAHAIRLLQMAVEFLSTGKFQVERYEDRQLLLDIKTGKWSLEDVKDLAEQVFKFARMAYNNSPLKDKPDKEAAEKLLMFIIEDHFKLKE